MLELRCVEAAPSKTLMDGEAVRLTGCLADADLAGLAELVGATAALGLRLDLCGGEEAPTAVVSLAEFLAAAGVGDRLLLVDGEAPRDDPAPELDVRRLPPRRRGLVGWFLPSSDDPVDDAQEHRGTVGTLREVLGDELPAAAATVASPALALRSGGCTACGTCVKACPTGVLALRRDGADGALEFEALGCIGCSACIDLCPVDALSAPGPLPWGELLGRAGGVTLEEFTTLRCERCHDEFAGGGSLCPVCAARRSNPFGSMLPPGFTRRR